MESAPQSIRPSKSSSHRNAKSSTAEALIEIARSDPDHLFDGKKAGSNALGRLPRFGAKKQRDNRIAIYRAGFGVFLRSPLGDDKCCSRDSLDFRRAHPVNHCAFAIETQGAVNGPLQGVGYAQLTAKCGPK